ncbi:flavodoxin [Bacillus phage v_B-Bak10]|uniref:NrdI n=1 Tax=Bacillus phage v_B-Bak10 TaxID=2094736 RepID=A0A385IK65_9CAUD|nr:flavodoxin [Bacillus phage v_B-Bak10]AXY83262.1 NrdI [Bacillus phage v_B-Bak10]
MKVIYDSKTGNVERFVKKLPFPCFSVKEIHKLDEPFVFITFTTGIGQVPSTSLNFLEVNKNYLKGVISSGNKVWGQNYGKAADIISAKYDVPVLCKFELSGDNHDVDVVIKEVNKIVKMG